MADNLKQIREKLGISDAVPDADIQALMGTKKGREEIAKVEADPKGGGSFLSHGIEALGQHWQQSEKPVTGVYDWLTSSLSKGDTGAGTSGAVSNKAKTKKAANLPSPAQASESPFTQIAQQLANEYLAQVQQLQSLTSGQQTPGLEAEAQGGAQAALKGLGVGGAGQQFVANAPQVPLSGEVAKSQQALGNAQSAGALGMAGAIANMGPAEAQSLGSAPYSTLLNELVNETVYRASNPSASGGGAAAFGANTSNIPSWLQTVFTQHGLTVPKPGNASSLGVPGLPGVPAAASVSGSVPSSTGTTGGP